MAKLKGSKSAKPAKDIKAALPCIFFLVFGMILLFLLLYYSLQS